MILCNIKMLICFWVSWFWIIEQFHSVKSKCTLDLSLAHIHVQVVRKVMRNFTNSFVKHPPGECFTKTKIDFKLDLTMAGCSCH